MNKQQIIDLIRAKRATASAEATYLITTGDLEATQRKLYETGIYAELLDAIY